MSFPGPPIDYPQPGHPAPSHPERPRRGPVRLIVFMDGTFQSRQTVFTKIHNDVATAKDKNGDWYTNVALLSQVLLPAADRPDSNGYVRPQISHYISGVGSTDDVVEKAVQGATGNEIGDKVQDAVSFIYDNWQPGDEVYLFGFSRGAFAARCVAGFLDFCGALTKPQTLRLPELWQAYIDRRPNELWTIAKAAYVLHDITGHWPNSSSVGVASVAGDLARGKFLDQVQQAVKHLALPKSAQMAVNTAQHIDPAHPPSLTPTVQPVPIKVVGVWDMVGALGLPGFFSTWGDQQLTSFFDPGLGTTVDNAFHALALHEDRKDFLPTMMYQQPTAPRGQCLRQAWFQGCHSDIGGGYSLHGLSDITLAWMVAQLHDHPSGPLLGIDLDHVKALQDRRYAWAKQAEHESRLAVELQAVRQVDTERLTKADLVNVVWADMLQDGKRNESIHHSVVVGGVYDPTKSEQFASLRKEGAHRLQCLWQQASDPNTLLPTERFLLWDAGREPQVKETPSEKVYDHLMEGTKDVQKIGERFRNRFHVSDTNNLRPSTLGQGLEALRYRWGHNPLTMRERIEKDSGYS